MWQALRSDLKEFVSVVTDPNASKDGEEDEENEEEEISPALEEAMIRMALEETYTQPLLEQVDEPSTTQDTSTDASDAEDVTAAREQIQEYIDSFSLEAHEEEIAKALELYGEVLQPILHKLVPETVTRRDFWMRYFYHCSVDRIQQEIAEQENRERLERVSQSIQGVRSFLGGAVMSVASSMLEDDDGGVSAIGISPFHMTSGGTRRPPFVMNTAVDEDEDGENEEELGWSDEDDGEDDEEEETEDQIEFKDTATEQLQEQLKQALEERDMLHQTVELQQKQIAELNSTQQAGASSVDVEQLQMQLFEKESELAAFRSKEDLPSTPSERHVSDQSSEKIEMLEKENAELMTALKDMESRKIPMVDEVRFLSLENENTELRANLDTVKAELAKDAAANEPGSAVISQKAQRLEEENAELKAGMEAKVLESEVVIQSMRSELAELRETVVALGDDKAKLAVSLNDKESEIDSIRASHATATAEKDARIEVLTEENLDLKALLKAKVAELSEVRRQLDNLSKQLETSCGESAASPDSVVKVEVDDDDDDVPDAPTKDEARKAGDDGSDDWGDDWGDEDE